MRDPPAVRSGTRPAVQAWKAWVCGCRNYRSRTCPFASGSVCIGMSKSKRCSVLGKHVGPPSIISRVVGGFLRRFCPGCDRDVFDRLLYSNIAGLRCILASLFRPGLSRGVGPKSFLPLAKNIVGGAVWSKKFAMPTNGFDFSKLCRKAASTRGHPERPRSRQWFREKQPRS